MFPQDQPLPPPQATKRRISLPGGLLIPVALLVIAIAVMLVMWKPWQPNIKASDRTVSVTGDATLTATPDEYVFSPSYDFTNADKQAALGNLTKKSDAVIAQLKSLGVADSDIKSNSSGYNNGAYYLPVANNGGTYTYTLDLTVTIHTSATAQKVQDYLVTTGPTGDVSPTADFSTAKQQALQGQARDKAEQDARAKADQSAKNLGFKVDQVKSVTDGSLDNGMSPQILNGATDATAQGATPKLSVQPGQNDFTYSVSVVYYIH